jgi:hypothetical protein
MVKIPLLVAAFALGLPPKWSISHTLVLNAELNSSPNVWTHCWPEGGAGKIVCGLLTVTERVRGADTEAAHATERASRTARRARPAILIDVMESS